MLNGRGVALPRWSSQSPELNLADGPTFPPDAVFSRYQCCARRRCEAISVRGDFGWERQLRPVATKAPAVVTSAAEGKPDRDRASATAACDPERTRPTLQCVHSLL